MDICAKCRGVFDFATMSLKKMSMIGLVISLLFATTAGAFECKNENQRCPRDFICTKMGNCLPCNQICMNGGTYHNSKHCQEECPHFQPPPTVLSANSPVVNSNDQSALPTSGGPPRDKISSQPEDSISNREIGFIVLFCVAIVAVIGLVVYIVFDKRKSRSQSQTISGKTGSSHGNGTVVSNGQANGMVSNGGPTGITIDNMNGTASNGEAARLLIAEDFLSQDPSAPPPNDEEEGDSAENKSPVVAHPEEGATSQGYEAKPPEGEVPVTTLTKDAQNQPVPKDFESTAVSPGIQETKPYSEGTAAILKGDPTTAYKFSKAQGEV